MALTGWQFGHYRLLDSIGSGAMGEVYLAEDIRIGRRVAVKVVRTEKVLYPNAAAATEAIRLFQREMKAIASLDHPNILPLIDFGEETVNNVLLAYMVMPFRSEGSLVDWLSRQSKTELLPFEDVINIVLQAARALQHAHNHNLIHLDVKPSNFLVRQREDHSQRIDLLLADFGIAKFTTATSTASQSVRGTPVYMAPEQWEGIPVAATDQYALAVMVYQLLTGTSPFQGNMQQVMYQHFHVRPGPPSTINSRLPVAVDTVLLRALEKKPNDRFGSISDFASALEKALQGNVPSPEIKPLDAPKGIDIRATLAISKSEAHNGTTRSLTLPGGRSTTVTLPAGTQDGQVIEIEGQGEPSHSGGAPGALILTISVKQEKEDPLNPLEPTVPVALDDPLEPTILASSANATVSSPIQESTSNVATEKTLPYKKVLLIVGIVMVLILGSIGGYLYAANTVDPVIATDAINSTIAQANANNIAHIDPSLAASNPDPYPPTNGKLTLYDPMHDNTNQGFGWAEGNGCTFTNAGYQVNSACTALNINLNNFAFEIHVNFTQVSTSQGAQVFFRSNSAFYVFSIHNDGTYSFTAYGKTFLGALIEPINVFNVQTDAIQQGAAANVMAVVAIGNNINLYVNGKQINSFQDNSSNYGSLFLSNNGDPVIFSNAKLWTF